MEVLNNYQRKKLDESNDEEFYSDPKFVYHLDANFRKNLLNVYKKEISLSNFLLSSTFTEVETLIKGIFMQLNYLFENHFLKQKI